MTLSQRKPTALFLRRSRGGFGVVFTLDSGYELALPLTVAQYVNLRDNEGLTVERSDVATSKELSYDR